MAQRLLMYYLAILVKRTMKRCMFASQNNLNALRLLQCNLNNVKPNYAIEQSLVSGLTIDTHKFSK